MFKSFRIFKLAGIPVYLHWSFFLLVIFVVGQAFMDGEPLEAILFDFLILMSVFICVTMHEYGHALMARRYGVITEDIILSPIGGVARLRSLPEKPWHEFLVAVAGPLVNVVILILLGIVIFGSYQSTFLTMSSETLSEGSFLLRYLVVMSMINLTLVLFNMIPAFPMDGGRVLRALLAMKLGKLKATKIAAYVGQGIAAIFVLSAVFNYPLFGNITSSIGQFTLGIIGVVIFSMARSEYQAVVWDEKMKGTTVASLMQRQFSHLYNSEQVDFAISRYKSGEETNFIVFDEYNQPIGLLQESILKFVDQRHESGLVGQYTTPLMVSIESNSTIIHAWEASKQYDQDLFPVMENGVTVGVISRETLYEYLNSK